MVEDGLDQIAHLGLRIIAHRLRQQGLVAVTAQIIEDAIAHPHHEIVRDVGEAAAQQEDQGDDEAAYDHRLPGTQPFLWHMLHGIEADFAEAQLQILHLLEILLGGILGQHHFEDDVEPLHQEAIGNTCQHVEKDAQDEAATIGPDVAQQLRIRLLRESEGLRRAEVGEVLAADFGLGWLGHLGRGKGAMDSIDHHARRDEFHRCAFGLGVEIGDRSLVPGG